MLAWPQTKQHIFPVSDSYVDKFTFTMHFLVYYPHSKGVGLQVNFVFSTLCHIKTSSIKRPEKETSLCTVFLSSYRNTSGSLGECGREMLWEHEPRRVFPQRFRVLPNFHKCFYNSREKQRTCSLFVLEDTATKATLNIKM